MENIKYINTPLEEDVVSSLSAGDFVYISGYIYTARDAAHARMIDSIKNNGEIPFDVKNQIIYYVGPSPAKPGNVIGSAGPTTSYRMDDYTCYLLERGLKGMIGKGIRSKDVIDSMKNNNCVYFAAIGGAGAYISNSIKEANIIAYDDLGPEAIRRLRVENFPAIVVIDKNGNNLYESERKKYEEK